MASSIRLLPLKKVERAVIPYSTVLSRVLSRRFIRACFTTFLLILPIALILSWFSPNNVSLARILFTLFASSFLSLLRSKLVLYPEQLSYSSAASELLSNLISTNFVKSIACFGVSAYIYFRNLILYVVPVYELQAHIEDTPEGIPESLALHISSSWYTVNDTVLSTVGFGVLIVGTISLLTLKDFVLELRSEETGLKPLQRLKLRAPTALVAAKQCLILAIVWPLVYLSIGRYVLFSWYKFWLDGTVVLTTWSPLSLLTPITLLPLFLLWSLSHQLFMVYISLGPLHKGKPLSELADTNANGTLLDGLSRDAGTITALMSWFELLVISEHFKNRRVGIYADVEGEQVLWERIVKCFEGIIQSHIKKLTEKKSVPDKPANSIIEPKYSLQEVSSSRIFSNTNQNISQSSADETFLPVGKQQQNLFRPQSALAEKLDTFSSKFESNSTVRTEKARAIIQKKKQVIISLSRKWANAFLKTRIGRLFSHTAERKLSAKIRNRTLTSFSLRAVARMVSHSLKEDEDGYVQGTIGSILALMDEFATLLEKVLSDLPEKGVDVSAKDSEDSTDLSCASHMLAEVNRSYLEISQGFSAYFENLNLNASVKRRCKTVLADKLEPSTVLAS